MRQAPWEQGACFAFQYLNCIHPIEVKNEEGTHPEKRIGREDDESATEFVLQEFEGDGPLHAESRVESVAGLRSLREQGKLIAVRMFGKPKGMVVQTNLVPHREIEGL